VSKETRDEKGFGNISPKMGEEKLDCLALSTFLQASPKVASKARKT